MHESIRLMANAFMKARSKRRKAYALFAALALIVSLTTTYLLVQPASAMADETICGMDAHEHSEMCYEVQFTCGSEASEGEEGHSHAEVGCVSEKQNVCICGKEECEAHTHEEECYSYTCGKAETEGHAHSEACYTTEKKLACETPAGHAHGDSCFDAESGEQTCTLEEAPVHQHDDSCYTEEQKLSCGKDEADVHSHGESCIGLTCGKTVTAGHAHEDACYEEQDVYTCGLEEKEAVPAHTHTEECYEEILSCGLEEHIHEDSCYELPEGIGLFGAFYGINRYDEELASYYLSDDPKGNTWQIVSGEYDSNFAYRYSDDGNVRIRKEVMSTDVENEFYIYLEVGAKTGWENLLYSSGFSVLTSSNKYSNDFYEGDITAAGVAGKTTILYFDEDDVPPELENVHEYTLILNIHPSDGSPAYKTEPRSCYGETPNCQNGSFLMYVPSLGKTVAVNRISLKNQIESGNRTITIEIYEKNNSNLGDLFVDTQISFETVTDVIGSNVTAQGVPYINFEGVVTSDGTFTVDRNNVGTWDLSAAAGSTEDEVVNSKDGNIFWTNYRVLYKVSLDVEADGFVSCAPNQTDPYNNTPQTVDTSDSIYETNSETVLNYKKIVVKEGRAGKGSSSATENSEGQLEAVSPQVQGLLYNYYLNKVDGSGNPMEGVSFTMTGVSGKEYTEESDANGLVSFIGLPCGTYTLTETVPNGYLADPTLEGATVTLCYTTAPGALVQDNDLYSAMMKDSRTEAVVNVELLNNGSLAISKNVKVDGVIKNSGTFTFEVSAKTASDAAVAGTYDLTYEPTNEELPTTITFDDNGVATDLQIPAGTTVTINGLPVGTTVTVTETDYDGYAPSWTLESDGSAAIHGATAQATVGTAPVTIYFTNTTGAMLPNTGGIGTGVYVATGTALMIGASLVLMEQERRRRRVVAD